MTLGLWGSDPDADLGRAKTAFADRRPGRLGGERRASASTLWAGAADLGRGRAVSLMTLAVALVLAVILAVGVAARAPPARAWHDAHRGHRRLTRSGGSRVDASRSRLLAPPPIDALRREPLGPRPRGARGRGHPPGIVRCGSGTGRRATQLRLAVATTYRVDPADAAVHVTLDVRARPTSSRARPRRFFYYDTLSFGIQPEARSISATQNGRALSLTARPRDGYRQIVVKTPRLLFRQPTLTRITFDLPSGEPRSDSAIRVGRAHTRVPGLGVGRYGAGRRPGRSCLRAFSGRGPDLPARYATSRRPRRSPAAASRPTSADDIEDPNRWHATVDVGQPQRADGRLGSTSPDKDGHRSMRGRRIKRMARLA